MNTEFTEKLQEWMNTPAEQRDWDEGALMLLQLSNNRIMYNNICHNPKGKAEFIEGKLKQYLKYRLANLTHQQVKEMQEEVNVIVAQHTEFKENNPAAEFKAGKRGDHDKLPEEIQALYVENLDITRRMRELHLKLRTMSDDGTACKDSDRYPFLKEFIELDKKIHANWEQYDHFVVEGADNVNKEEVPSETAEAESEEDVAPAETQAEPVKAPAKKPTRKSKKK